MTTLWFSSLYSSLPIVAVTVKVAEPLVPSLVVAAVPLTAAVNAVTSTVTVTFALLTAAFACSRSFACTASWVLATACAISAQVAAFSADSAAAIACSSVIPSYTTARTSAFNAAVVVVLPFFAMVTVYWYSPLVPMGAADVPGTEGVYFTVLTVSSKPGTRPRS